MNTLDKIVQNLNREFFGNSLKVGRYFIYRNKPIKIISGYFLDPVYHRLSNHWTWQEVLSDGTLGKKGQGYGGNDKIFKPITKQEAIKLAKKSRRHITTLEQKNKELEQENKELRRLLWLTHHNHFKHLYGDDGEMQCSKCLIDFKRDPIKKIFLHLMPTKE